MEYAIKAISYDARTDRDVEAYIATFDTKEKAQRVIDLIERSAVDNETFIIITKLQRT